LYRYLEAHKIPCCQFSGCTRIRRTDIDALFKEWEYIKREKKEAEPIEEFYTTKEILEKFGISNSRLFKMAKERNIPKTVVRGKTLWSRKHIDNALADKQPTETVAEEWYSVEEVCAKFNMSKGGVNLRGENRRSITMSMSTPMPPESLRPTCRMNSGIYAGSRPYARQRLQTSPTGQAYTSVRRRRTANASAIGRWT